MFNADRKSEKSEQMCACSVSFTAVSLPIMHGACFVQMLRTRVDRNRAYTGVNLWGVHWLGGRCFVVRVVCGRE